LSYDSRTPGNGSGSKTEYGLYQMGQCQLGFQTNAMATSCNFATDSAVTWKPVNVVACSPKWLLAGNPAVNQHLPPTSISLYVPSDMWDVLAHDLSSPAIQAAADWNEQLAGTGVSVTVVNYDCGTGGNCIDLTTGDTGSGCAMNTRHPDLSTGEFNLPSTITLPTDFASRSSARLRRTLAHELGHLLGLDEYDGSQCSPLDTATPANSIMAPVSSCTSTTDLTLSPTLNDVSPIVQSTYGSHVRTTCGF